jgi:hypothetical protein
MATVKKTDHVSGRVSADAVKNITMISEVMKWSFNQTLEEAMLRLKLEDIVIEISKQNKK